jgi:hypothetical protein
VGSSSIDVPTPLLQLPIFLKEHFNVISSGISELSKSCPNSSWKNLGARGQLPRAPVQVLTLNETNLERRP